MGEFFMIVGLPGSGKTYLANQIIKKASEGETIWLSSDKIREELYGSENEQGDPSKVFEQMRIRTESALKEGKNVVYDACNINSKKRMAFLNNIKRLKCEKVCIICATPYPECVRRNNQRSRVVPEDVIRRMYKNWNTPFYYEGWDQIVIQYAEGAKESYGTAEKFVEDHMDFQQENPFHLETLGQHLKETKEYLVGHFGCEEESNLAVAALLHDCGKPFTKEFCDMRGNPTEIAHYAFHQCCGAYDALFYKFENKTEDDILEISVLVNSHMHPFGWDEEKRGEKQRKQWGEKIYQDVLKLHEADKAASHH